MSCRGFWRWEQKNRRKTKTKGVEGKCFINRKIIINFLTCFPSPHLPLSKGPSDCEDFNWILHWTMRVRLFGWWQVRWERGKTSPDLTAPVAGCFIVFLPLSTSLDTFSALQVVASTKGGNFHSTLTSALGVGGGNLIYLNLSNPILPSFLFRQASSVWL